jgi:hypothetical protein
LENLPIINTSTLMGSFAYPFYMMVRQSLS